MLLYLWTTQKPMARTFLSMEMFVDVGVLTLFLLSPSWKSLEIQRDIVEQLNHQTMIWVNKVALNLMVVISSWISPRIKVKN